MECGKKSLDQFCLDLGHSPKFATPLESRSSSATLAAQPPQKKLPCRNDVFRISRRGSVTILDNSSIVQCTATGQTGFCKCPAPCLNQLTLTAPPDPFDKSILLFLQPSHVLVNKRVLTNLTTKYFTAPDCAAKLAIFPSVACRICTT